MMKIIKNCPLAMLFGMSGIITILRMGYFTGILKRKLIMTMKKR